MTKGKHAGIEFDKHICSCLSCIYIYVVVCLVYIYM